MRRSALGPVPTTVDAEATLLAVLGSNSLAAAKTVSGAAPVPSAVTLMTTDAVVWLFTRPKLQTRFGAPLQTAGEALTNVTFGGRAAVTFTPFASEPPPLKTFTVYANGLPRATDAGDVAETARSAWMRFVISCRSALLNVGTSVVPVPVRPFIVVNVELFAREPKVRIWKVFQTVGVKPLTTLTLSVPASVTLPVTTSWSYCVPAVVPPSWMPSEPLGPCT